MDGGMTGMGKSFATQRRVEFCETDAAGITHFSSFMCFMEQAEHEFLRSLGLSVIQPVPEGGYLSWPRVRVECNYLSPARFEEVLQVTLEITRLGSKSVTYKIAFQSGERQVAHGLVVAVCCHVQPEKKTFANSIEIPDAIRSLLLPFLNAN
jgi:acyl-CoA thioester hydrolase